MESISKTVEHSDTIETAKYNLEFYMRNSASSRKGAQKTEAFTMNKHPNKDVCEINTL